ncbi:RagB/SusD family nutrient uptake outer membrane protein [Bacteroides ovatus]|nr:RagB/SusD family nutrient uptake outer membrane protein [Bacteroides ovatus]
MNGDKFKGAQKVQIYEGATQAPYKDGRMSYNGVAMRKFIRNFNDEVNGKFYSCPLIRLPEVYLNMAEAMNELNKAEVRDEFGNTAYDYLNKTRLRVGMPAISATDVPAGKPLREAILRERAIEFGYEEVRYFDLVRWKRADIFTGQLSRLIIKKAAGEPSGFSYAVSHAMAETRQYAKPEKWNDKYFLLPLPIDEINKKYGLIQNPGW